MSPTSDQLPNDIEALKELLLKALHANAALEENNQNLKKRSEVDAKEIRLLKQQIALYLAQKYGRRTEIHPGQGSLFNEAESEAAAVEGAAEETTTVAEHNRRKGGRRPIPENLPREEVVIDLPAEEKFCNAAGCNHAELQRIGEETSEQYDIAPSRIFVLKTIRPKYACPCCREGVRIAPAPLQPIPKSNASPGILAHIAVSKYADGLPLYRQEKILERLGLDLSRSSGWSPAQRSCSPYSI
jgi:transposase